MKYPHVRQASCLTILAFALQMYSIHAEDRCECESPGTVMLDVLARDWAARKGWPLRNFESHELQRVNADNDDSALSKIVANFNAICADDNKQLSVCSIPEDKRGALLERVAESKIVQAGDTLITADWDIGGLQPFSTIGLIDINGEPKFEPVLYLSGLVDVDCASVHHSAITVPYGVAVINGFGVKVVEAGWETIVQANGCTIDPGEHVRVTRCHSSFLWSVQCTNGERAYPERSRACPQGDSCIKYVLQAKWVSGLGKVEVEGSAKAKYAGVDLEAKLKATTYIGESDEHEAIGILCANGPITLNGKPLNR